MIEANRIRVLDIGHHELRDDNLLYYAYFQPYHASSDEDRGIPTLYLDPRFFV